jgi:hypothetical protein
MLTSDLDAKSGVHFNTAGVAIAPSTVMTTGHVERLIAASLELLEQKSS